MHFFAFFLVVFMTTIIATSNSTGSGRLANGRRGELAPIVTSSPPAWNTAPAAAITYRLKGDFGDLDPRGSVRYNIAPNGRIMRGIITKQREVPTDDGAGVEQAKEECCHADSY